MDRILTVKEEIIVGAYNALKVIRENPDLSSIVGRTDPKTFDQIDEAIDDMELGFNDIINKAVYLPTKTLNLTSNALI